MRLTRSERPSADVGPPRMRKTSSSARVCCAVRARIRTEPTRGLSSERFHGALRRLPALRWTSSSCGWSRLTVSTARPLRMWSKRTVKARRRRSGEADFRIGWALTNLASLATRSSRPLYSARSRCSLSRFGFVTRQPRCWSTQKRWARTSRSVRSASSSSGPSSLSLLSQLAERRRAPLCGSRARPGSPRRFYRHQARRGPRSGARNRPRRAQRDEHESLKWPAWSAASWRLSENPRTLRFSSLSIPDSLVIHPFQDRGDEDGGRGTAPLSRQAASR